MIKLTLDPERDATQQTFDKKTVILGAAQQDDPLGTLDLILADVPTTLLLRIELEDGNFTIHNINAVAEALVNNESFSSKELSSGDRITIGSVILDFDGDFVSQHETADDIEVNFDIDSELEKLEELFADDDEGVDDEGDTMSLETIDQLLEDVDALEAEEEASRELRQEVEPEMAPEEIVESVTEQEDITAQQTPLQDESSEAEASENEAEEDSDDFLESDDALDDIELQFDDSGIDDALDEALVQQSEAPTPIEEELEPIDEEESDILAQQSDEEDGKSWRQAERALSMEIDELESESDAGFIDEDDFITEEVEEERSGWVQKLLVAAAVVILICGISGIGTTFYLRSQNAEKELIASRGVADIGMALAHARAHALLPYNNNPMDSDFLEENLLSVLSPQYRLISPIRSETGHLSEENYQLQVVASTDLSRYLVIALPEASFSQTLAPLPCIVLSSDNMEIRRSYQRENWENFIHDVHSLDQVDDSMDTLLRSAEFVRLSSLEDPAGKQGFTLPKELTLVLPEAEGRLYNAPRYYILTEGLVSQISAASQGLLSQRELAVFQQAFDSLSQLPFFIMYTSKSSELAEDVTETIKGVRWKRKPLIGHVTLDPQSDLIQEVRVLVDSDMAKLTEYIEEQEMLKEVEASCLMCTEDAEVPIAELSVDPNHPLFVTLTEISGQRQHALTQIGERITLLLSEHNRKEVPDFFHQHQRLLKDYQEVSRDYHNKISRILTNLYQDYVVAEDKESLAVFLATVKATDLESLLPSELLPKNELKSKSSSKEDCHIEALLNSIPESGELAEINELTEALNDSLKELERQNPSLAANYRNQLRNRVLRKIGDLLLSPQSQEVTQTFQEQNRAILNRIFDNADISDLEERQFYLNEFDLLMSRFRSISHQTLQELQDLDDQIVRDLENTDLDIPYRMTLERQHEEFSEQIATQRAAVNELKSQMSRLPINTATTSHEERKQNLGRLGQQVLIQASLNEPSSSRDETLREAIALLVESTNENRSLWEDILEARRLLTETPRQDITEILKSDLGFDPDKPSMAANIRNLMTQYINEQQNLLLSQNEEHYQALFEAFREKQQKNLNVVIETAETMEDRCRTLIDAMDTYITRLEDFQSDYIRAKDEGFFFNNRRYHNIMSGRLRDKLKAAKDLRSELEHTCHALIQAGQAHKALCKKELDKLDRQSHVTADTTAKLVRNSNNVSYPNLLTGNLRDNIQEMIDIGVYPVSQ